MGVINFVTAHDGFTLHDLVSYDVKHNQVNGESNRDGTNDNRSFNHGAEGDYADKKVRQVRYKAMRNLMATLLLSAGVPMIAAGDERAKSQLGNNNAYCQDNVISWVNWKLNEDQSNFEETFAFLTKLRRDNKVLRPTSFGNFDAATVESDQIRWYNREGEIMPGDQWDDPEHRTLQRYSAHLEADGSLSAMLLVIHGSEVATEAKLPTELANAEYQLLWDSNLATPPTTQPSFLAGSKFKLAGTSMKIFRVNFLTTV
jgi:glycogen operon protein